MTRRPHVLNLYDPLHTAESLEGLSVTVLQIEARRRYTQPISGIVLHPVRVGDSLRVMNPARALYTSDIRAISAQDTGLKIVTNNSTYLIRVDR